MKLRNLIIFFTIILSLPLAHAMNVSVIIQFPSKTEIYIVNVSSNATAKQALIATGLNTTWNNGTFLNCISGVCGSSSDWWCFTYMHNGDDKWVFSNVGLASYNCSEGDAIGLKFLSGSDANTCVACFGGCDFKTIEEHCSPLVSSILEDYSNDVVYWSSNNYEKAINIPYADMVNAYSYTNGSYLFFKFILNNLSTPQDFTSYRIYLNTDNNASSGCSFRRGAELALEAFYNITSSSWSFNLLKWNSTAPSCPSNFPGEFVFNKSVIGSKNLTENYIELGIPFSDLNISPNATSFKFSWSLGNNQNITGFVETHFDRDGDSCVTGWVDAYDYSPGALDIDGDGIPDFKDACPLEKETVNGYQDNDGCPDTPPSSGGGEISPEVIKEEEKLQDLASIDAKRVRDIIYQFNYQTKSFFVAKGELAGVLASIDSFAIPEDYSKEVDFITWKKVEKLEGDVYRISAEKVLEKFKKAEKTIIARGDLSVDSLAAVAYARASGMPILLTKPEEMPEVTKKTLEKLGVKEIVVIGGDKAVAEESVKNIKHRRIAGEDRYETAVKLAEELEKIKKFNKVIITDGERPSMVSAMIAGKYSAPIIYVKGSEIPEVTLEYIKNNKDKDYILVGLGDEVCKEINSFIS